MLMILATGIFRKFMSGLFSGGMEEYLFVSKNDGVLFFYFFSSYFQMVFRTWLLIFFIFT